MDVRAITEAPAGTGADTIAVGVFDGEGVAHDLPGGELTALLERGEARTAFRKLALTHADGRRWLARPGTRAGRPLPVLGAAPPRLRRPRGRLRGGLGHGRLRVPAVQERARRGRRRRARRADRLGAPRRLRPRRDGPRGRRVRQPRARPP